MQELLKAYKSLTKYYEDENKEYSECIAELQDWKEEKEWLDFFKQCIKKNRTILQYYQREIQLIEKFLQ